jgi:hypothetical protein
MGILHLKIYANLLRLRSLRTMHNVGIYITCNTKETDGGRCDALLPVAAFDGISCFIRKPNCNNFI